MTYSFRRTALILLAGSALTVCVAPESALAEPTVPAPEAIEAAPAVAMAPPAVDAFARTRRASGPAATYKVRKGDTLAGIAGKLGVDMDDLAKANGLKRPYRLQPGQVLKNPKAKAASAAPKRSGGASSSKAGSGGQTYTVKSGDTLFGISKRFGVTVEALRGANGLRGSSIARGQTLKIPGGQVEEAAPSVDDAPEAPARAASPRSEPQAEPAPSSSGAGLEVTGPLVNVATPGRAYRVRKGDTLEGVAGKLDSSVSELARLNKLKKPYRIHPGQTIRGPGGTAKAYVVQRGDTLGEIAQRFSTTVDKLRAANGLKRGAAVAPGRKLRLPAGYRDRGPIESTGSAPRTPPRPSSSFDTPPPAGQVLPPPRSAPRPPVVQLPSEPQPYRPSGPPVGAPTASPPVSDAQIMQMGRGLFAWPLRGDLISGFGDRGVSQRNDGVNIRAAAGEPVRASAAGDVVYAGDQVPGFGNLVLIKHADGWVTAYGHLGRVDVRMQQKVAQGQQIGQAGSTGGVSEPQLHFEVRFAPTPQERARPVNPTLVLPQ